MKSSQRLIDAAKAGDERSVAKLLKEGTDVNFRTSEGFTARTYTSTWEGDVAFGEYNFVPVEFMMLN